MVETLAESFEITFKQLQKEREAEDVSRVDALSCLTPGPAGLLPWCVVILFPHSFEEDNSWLNAVSQ